MRVCILSDLHLGCGPQNDFCLSDASTAALLRRLAESHDYLVINGDFLELWEPGGLAVLPQSEGLFRKIREAWPRVLAAVDGTPNIIVLAGNHDAAAHQKGWLAKARAELLVPELSLFVAHGHQGDRLWCSEGSPFLRCVKCLACCVGYWELLFDPDFDERLARAQNLANHETDGELTEYAFAVARRLGVKTVCLGHTHAALVEKRDGVVYVNCGKCADSSGRVQYVVVESEGAIVTVSLRSAAPDGEWHELARETSSAAMDCEQVGRLCQQDVPGSQLSRGSLVLLPGGRLVTQAESFLEGGG